MEFSPDSINFLLKQAMKRLGIDDEDTNNKNDRYKKDKKISLTPSQALVIIGLLGGVLDVDSVQVGKGQRVQISLTGSLKRKTQLDQVMDQICDMPFDTVMKAFLGRFM